MRKNNGNREREQSVKTVFEIKGLNLDRFINIARKKGVALYDIKKFSVKRMQIAVNLSDSEKFFAIAKELCYNIRKIRHKGVGYPFYYLIKNFGLVIGAIIFIAVAVFFNDLVFETTFVGSGKIYSREASEYLQSVGVKEYSRFSDIDLKTLGEGLLKSNEHLSFVSCKKKGNRLEVQLVLSQDKVKTLSGDVYELKTEVDGVIEKIKVYRGTALYSVGDSVKAGDVIVGGFAEIKEQTVKINVIASVTMLVEKEFYYRCDKPNQESIASALAEEEISQGTIVSSTTTVVNDGKEYVYKTAIKYRVVYFAG